VSLDAVEGSETDEDLLARCVFIENVPEEMCEFLEVVIENSNSGGGPVELFEPDQTHGGVLVRFVDEQGSNVGHIQYHDCVTFQIIFYWYCCYHSLLHFKKF